MYYIHFQSDQEFCSRGPSCVLKFEPTMFFTYHLNMYNIVYTGYVINIFMVMWHATSRAIDPGTIRRWARWLRTCVFLFVVVII